MAREISRDAVFISATEPILYDGCDFRLYWASVGLCFLGGVSLFCILPMPSSLYAIGGDLIVFFCIRWGVRELAKADPLAVPIYLRHIKWPAFLPAQGKLLQTHRPNPLRKKK